MGKTRPSKKPNDDRAFGRIARPLTLSAQVERILRQGIAEGRFVGGRLPTEIELAEQLGVSRETVRLAAEVLQREGLLVKIRRKGTFTQFAPLASPLRGPDASVLAYLQATYPTAQGAEEAVTSTINALMLQGAVAEAGLAGRELIVRNAPSTHMAAAFQQLQRKAILGGAIFASFGEEKLLRRGTGMGIPLVLLDHDVHLPQINSVREDSLDGARQAVCHLAGLGHRRVAMANWSRAELNPWRLEGYQQGMREAGLPCRRRWKISVALTEAGAREATQQLLELSPRPTAIYCFNNTLAQRIIHNLREAGVRVPEDISVMGGGGEVAFGLTCHQADWQQIGRKAVQILITHAGHATTTPEHHLFPHTLILGTSTAPPP